VPLANLSKRDKKAQLKQLQKSPAEAPILDVAVDIYHQYRREMYN
jgi:hypothetical protein